MEQVHDLLQAQHTIAATQTKNNIFFIFIFIFFVVLNSEF